LKVNQNILYGNLLPATYQKYPVWDTKILYAGCIPLHGIRDREPEISPDGLGIVRAQAKPGSREKQVTF
jgi:hypothetical protein